MGAPITGMIVLGVVQTLLALSTISPTLSEQFSALVNLAVVTNVIPYIVSLSALFVMMKSRESARRNVYTRNVVITVVAMAYSVFALYASGKDAVMGGMLVLGIAYIVWGFIATRFAGRSREVCQPPRRRLTVPRAIAARRTTCKLNESKPHARRLAFRAITARRLLPRARGDAGNGADDRPYQGSWPHQARLPRRRASVHVRGAAGAPRGLRDRAVSAGRRRRSRSELGLPQLTVQWVPVTSTTALRDVQQGNVDLLCTPTSVTLARRQEVSFSIPVFAGGIRAVLRADAPQALRDALRNSADADIPCGAAHRRQSDREDDVRRRYGHDVGEPGSRAGAVPAGRRERRAGSRLSHRAADCCRRARSTCSSASGRSCSAHGRCGAQESRGPRPPVHAGAAGRLALAKGDDDFRALVDRRTEPHLRAERISRSVRASGSAHSTTRRARSSSGTRLRSNDATSGARAK